MTTPSILGVDGVTPIVELGVGDPAVATGTARWDSGRWDVNTWGSPTDPAWWDITCFVQQIDTYTGRQRLTDVVDVGTCVLTVDNETGWADYPATTGGSTLTLRPGRPARVSMRLADGTVHVLWRGYIDAVRPAYIAAESDQVTIECIDAKGEAGRVEIGRLGAPVGDGDTVNQRIGRVLDAAGWSSSLRALDVSAVPLVATALGGAAVDLLNTAAASSGGIVYGDRNGMVAFRNREWQSRPPAPPDGRIGNSGSPGEVCPNGWVKSFARGDFTNRVIYGRSGEATRQLDETASQAEDLYRVETYRMTSLETKVDADMDAVAARTLTVRGFAQAPRVESVDLDAARPGVPALAAQADPFRPGIYACYHAEAARVVISQLMHLTGVAHSIGPDEWLITLSLDNAAPFLAAAGRWDQGRWDQCVWDIGAA